MENNIEKDNKKDKPKKYWNYIILGVTLGILFGYLYFRIVGCKTGACPLKANPYYNMFLGGLLGYVVADWLMIIKSRKK